MGFESSGTVMGCWKINTSHFRANSNLLFLCKESLDLSKAILDQVFHTLKDGAKTSLNTYFVTVKKLCSLLSKMFDRYD